MKKKTSGLIVAAVLTAAVVLAALTLRVMSQELVYPIEKSFQLLSRKVCFWVVGAVRGSSAMAENSRLKREIASLAVIRADCERLEAENSRLRKTLGYRDRIKGDWLAAGVLSRYGAAGVQRTLRVDKGTDDGVREGAVVISPDGLVGRIVTATPHTAEVMLLSDGSFKVSCEVECAGGVRVRGILSDGTEDTLLLRHISGALEIPVRSRVLTSGLGGVFPRGIDVGTVLFSNADPDRQSVECVVQPSVEFQSLEDVFIRRER